MSGLLGGIGSAVAGIVGSNASRKAANRNAQLLQEAENDAKAWYDKEYNSNFLDRSDARAAIARTRDILNERYKAAEGAAAVTGATAESVAQQKAAANQTLADVTGTIAERADAHKEAVRANYEAQQNNLMQQKMGVNNQKAQAVTTAASGLANAFNSFGEAAEGLFKKKGE